MAIAQVLNFDTPAPGLPDGGRGLDPKVIGATDGITKAMITGNLDNYAQTFKDVGSMTAQVTAELVKGIGYAYGGNKPIEDPKILAPAIFNAQDALIKATRRGIKHPDQVVKGFSPDFQTYFQRFLDASPQFGSMNNFVAQLNQQLSTILGKDISLTSPLSSGIVPFDLVAPTRLIYPVYTPLRNKLPRVPGQGTSRRSKIITGIPGTQTGGSSGNPIDWAISEFPSGQSFNNNWPMQLPASDNETAIDLSVPYRFFGRSENISWLSQFSGQGFEDISALANLILIQKGSLAEEYQTLYQTNAALTAPSAPTVTLRSPGTGETALSGITTNLYVLVTALDGFGRETAYASGNVQSVAPSSQVADVTISPVLGAAQYNIYTATGASNPGRTGFWLWATVGASTYTLYGAIPTSGTNPPSANGTGNSNGYDGIFSILSGKAAGGTYPAGVQGGYVNQTPTQTGGGPTQARVSIFNAALYGLWQTTKADVAEIWMEGSDMGRLSDDIRQNASTNGYRLAIPQDEFNAIIAGAAVASFVNPITRKLVSLTVHPWLKQGTSLLMSYTIPFPFSNVSNIWEQTNVQDYLSIAWPVVDVTFRYSLFLYGALVCYAPIYCGILQGLQVSDTKPYK